VVKQLMKQNEKQSKKIKPRVQKPFHSGGPIERHQGSIRVRIDVQREGSDYWARVVIDPSHPELMPLASGPTRETAIQAAGEKASIPLDVEVKRGGLMPETN
jgi:putative AlgH/UPF0301 family transcriptional regulator